MTVLRKGLSLAIIAAASMMTACTTLTSGPAPAGTGSSSATHPSSEQAPSASDEPANDKAEPPEIMSATGLAFVDPEHGFVGGLGGIWSTADGGEAWRRVWKGAQAVITLDAVDAMHVWASVAGRSGRHAELLRTVDGGSHWAVLDRGTEYGQLAMTSTSSGWAIAAPTPATTVGEPFLVEPGRVVRSSDGGETWQPAGTTAQSLCGLDGATAWVAERSIVRRTLDAGKTWTTERLHPHGWFAVGEIRCADATTAWDLAWGGGTMSRQPYIASRTLDGVTWTPMLREAFFPGPPGAHTTRGEIDAYSGPFAVPDADTAIFAGSSNAVGDVSVTATSNAGNSFRHVQIGPIHERHFAAPLDISFTGPTDGWLLVGEPELAHTRLWHTTDGGASWIKLVLAG